MSPPDEKAPARKNSEEFTHVEVRVRRIHRRDLNRTWEFLKKVFRDVNLETVEYQRPRTKRRFLEVYQEDGVEQLLFEVGSEIVGYAECAYEAVGEDSWVNPRYFERRDMRPFGEGVDPRTGEATVAVNVRCLPEVDLASLKVVPFDGASM